MRCTIGYEVHYKYYNKKENSFDYDQENPLILKKVYGKIEEDYPLEKLMSHVNTQYARRDIFIFDADFYEFVRKKITFKQTKNGFSIKNKKFNAKDTTVIEFEEETVSENNLLPHNAHLAENHPVVQPAECVAPIPAPITNAPPVNIAQSHQVQPKQKRVVKNVVFAPISVEARQKFPYKFTVNKSYPVFSEKPVMNGIGTILETVDDLGQTVKVSDELFISNDINLIGDSEVEFTPKNNNNLDNRLNWSGVVKDNSVPKLR